MFGKTTMSSRGTSSIVLKPSLLVLDCIPVSTTESVVVFPAGDPVAPGLNLRMIVAHAESDAPRSPKRHAEGRRPSALAPPRAGADDRAARGGERADEGLHQPAGAGSHGPVAFLDRTDVRHAPRPSLPHLPARAPAGPRPASRAPKGRHVLRDREPPALLA